MQVESCIIEQWLGDQYDVQGMDSLSVLNSNCIGTCNIGAGARGAVAALPPIRTSVLEA